MSRAACGSASAPVRRRRSSSICSEQRSPAASTSSACHLRGDAQRRPRRWASAGDARDEPFLDLTVDGADEIDGDSAPDQGRRRRVAAREDRRHRLGPHDGDRRCVQEGRDARCLPAAARGRPLRPRRYPQHDHRAGRGRWLRRKYRNPAIGQGRAVPHRRRQSHSRLPLRPHRRSRRSWTRP